MSKAELIAMLQTLSQKLDRELSIEGNNAELEARVKEAAAELEMLGDDTSDGDGDGVSEGSSEPAPDVTTSNFSRRRVKLSTTLDIWHYKKGANRNAPNNIVRVREIVPVSTDILVDSDEAAEIIANGHGRAL